jgi:pilus assembly protein Flp/PilA
MKAGSFIARFSRYRTDQSGATAIEYGLIAGMISIGIITATTSIGASVLSFFESIRW